METKIKLRKIAAPLNVFVSLYTKTGVSTCPLTQTYDLNQNEYVIDRTYYPTIIVPNISLAATDGSISFDNTSEMLTNIKWYVQSKDGSIKGDISTISYWSPTDYSIATTENERGSITIKKNIPSESAWALWLEADFADTRTGTTNAIHIASERVMISTTTNAESGYTASIDAVDGYIYYPLLDKRIEYDYLIANNISQTTTFTDDGRTYLKTITVGLNQGTLPLVCNDDYAISIEIYSSNGYKPIDDESIYIDSIINETITFNLQRSYKETFKINFIKNGSIVSYKIWGYAWNLELPNFDIISASTYNEKATNQSFKAVVSYKNAIFAYPEAYVHLDWYLNGKTIGSGANIEIQTSTIASDGDISLALNLSLLGISVNATDENGNYLTDENNNRLIIN